MPGMEKYELSTGRSRISFVKALPVQQFSFRLLRLLSTENVQKIEGFLN
jgi:hypothetical protein